jgi:ATP-binding cassette, subfamily B, bacterial PglK
MVNSKFSIKKSQLSLLWWHLSQRRRKQFWLLLLLMILASITEIVSIGAVLPFLGVLTAPEQIHQHPLIQPVNQLLNVTAPRQLILPLTILFIGAALFAGTIRLALLYVMTRLSYAIGADLSINIYRRTLYQEYAVHVSRNSSEVINGIITKTGTVIGGVITPTLHLVSSAIIITAILATLFAIDTVVALTALLVLGILYFGIIRYTKKQIRENSETIANQSTQMVKSLQEGLGGIRDVLIDGSQQFYCSLYRKADLPLRRASGNNAFISIAPRYAMEALGMTVIAVVAYSMSLREDGLITVIPILGALALGAQRLLPALQQAYGAYSTLKSSHSSFKDVLKLLNQPLPQYALQTEKQNLPAPILFEKEIVLNNLNFRYAVDGITSTPWVLKNIKLTLTKGARIGFMGVTGSGKSTLINIIMGLLPPTSGEITIDGESVTYENRRAWQAHIAHVPQDIYLSDSTIEENIAFGIPKEKIDRQQVEKAAKQAQIAELIDEWQDGYQTFVGERGIRLSGGQRQRIGIARALYKQADVLVFDEATSALDNETEQSVMKAIDGLEREMTILIIAHRLTTFRGCDSVVKLEKDGLVNVTHEFK